jgi:cellulose synthase/poly-beta-1,6-N-acetylglucosamine synthase-like glycosyltransferase
LPILDIIVAICIAVFVGFYLFYLAICILCSRIKREKTFANQLGSVPTVSIIVPTYNEAKVIQRKMDNLLILHYPRDKLEIVFVDGGSSDGTVELIEKLVKETQLPVKVIREGHRRGFNRAVIEGFGQTSGEIICVPGAETEYDPSALEIMVQHFADSRIGAVTGKQEIRNIQDGYSPRLEASYRRLYDLVREAESAIDSPFDIKGEMSASRRSVFAHLVEKPELVGKGAIDTCISFQARMDGYSTVYEPRAVYHELSPMSLRDSFKQQKRRAATLIENMMVFRGMILNRRFGAFGMLIMPAHFLMLTILPFVLLVGSIAAVLAVAVNSQDYVVLLASVVTLLGAAASSRVQAFLKTQLVLITATIGMFVGTETQKFERLSSVRP